MRVFTLLVIATDKNKNTSVDVKVFEKKVDASSYMCKIRKSKPKGATEEVLSYGWKYKITFSNGTTIVYEIKSQYVIDYVVNGKIVKDAYLLVPWESCGAKNINSGWL